MRGIELDEVVGWLDQRALLLGRWGLRVQRGQTFAELARENAPRLDAAIELMHRRELGQFGVTYGYWPVMSDGDDLVLLEPGGGGEIARFHFERQARAPYLALPDYFRDAAEVAALGPDVIAMQLVTVGPAASRATAELFAANRYRDYLELHGLTVQLAEALAQLWHAHVRAELGLGAEQGQRYSFGYPACPDLTQRRPLYELVNGGAIGVTLSETFQLVPEQSTDALIVHHPQARYFSVH